MENIKNQYYKSEETSKIINACITVHKVLGPGYREIIYQRALSRELWKRDISHAREEWLDVHYDGLKIGKKRVDFIIDEIIIETKAKAEYDPQDYFQTISYLKASKFKLALLINFGSNKVQIKRFVNQQNKPINR